MAVRGFTARKESCFSGMCSLEASLMGRGGLAGCSVRGRWLVGDGMSRVFERNERRYGLLLQMSAVSRVGFLKSGLTLVLKEAGNRPEVRKEFIRKVRNGRILEIPWRKEEGMGLRGLAAGVKEQLISFTFLVK